APPPTPTHDPRASSAPAPTGSGSWAAGPGAAGQAALANSRPAGGAAPINPW
ncbi:hypothetical protein P7K49_001579, partial [Saguinus oedipus]